MIDPGSLRRRALPVDRSSDRRVALGSVAVAIGFVAAAIVSTLLPEAVRRGPWLPIHLAMAGAATTAIAGVMPFFVAAIAAAPPSDPRLRGGAVASVAVGAIGVSTGVVASMPWFAGLSGLVFITGVGLVALATVRPLRNALGPRRGIVTRGYLAALLQVAIGAGIATLLLLGWGPVAGDWPRARVAHAWLNVVGFVSLVVGSTLLHFFPTVVGSRIVAHRSATVAVAGIGFGAPLVAGGVILALDIVARIGATLAMAGAAGLSVYAWRVWRTRATWTTDPGWHAFAIGGLVSAIAWLDLGMLAAVVRVLVEGASPAAWSSAPVVGPLVAGWVGLALVASVSHLIPAVGPGDIRAHARQRRVLGRLAFSRLGLIDIGVVGLSVGLWLGVPALAQLGLASAAIGFGLTAILVAAAVWLGARPAPTRAATQV